MLQARAALATAQAAGSAAEAGAASAEAAVESARAAVAATEREFPLVNATSTLLIAITFVAVWGSQRLTTGRNS